MGWTVAKGSLSTSLAAFLALIVLAGCSSVTMKPPTHASPVAAIVVVRRSASLTTLAPKVTSCIGTYLSIISRTRAHGASGAFFSLSRNTVTGNAAFARSLSCLRHLSGILRVVVPD
jgi:hypothetical protein